MHSRSYSVALPRPLFMKTEFGSTPYNSVTETKMLILDPLIDL